MVLLAALVCPVPGSAEKGPAVKDYPVDRVAEDVYVIHGPLGMPAPENQGFMNNPAFVITDDGVVVIDPGASVQSGEMFLRVMAKVTKSDVMIEIPGRSIAFLGDNVLNNRVPRIDGGLIQGNMRCVHTHHGGRDENLCSWPRTDG